MKRWMVVLTVAALVTIGAVGGLGVAPAGAQSLVPHAPIVINGNGGFTAANGVSNPLGCGLSSLNPCVIQNWSISPPPGGICISITGTST